MNSQEIIAELQKQEISVSDFAYSEMGNPLPNIGQWEEIDQHGGEGQGDDWWSVKYFSEHDIYLKVSGSYVSHYGADFDDWPNAVKEVKPTEKTIKVYE